MPSSWEVYYLVFLSGGLALGVPLLLWAASKLFKHQPSNKEAGFTSAPKMSKPSEDFVGVKLNTRFFSAANIALIILAITLLMIPCVGAARSGRNFDQRFISLVVFISISALILLAVLYSVRKGDLNWMTSYRKDSDS